MTSKKLLPLLLPSFEVSNTENEVHGVLRLLGTFGLGIRKLLSKCKFVPLQATPTQQPGILPRAKVHLYVP